MKSVVQGEEQFGAAIGSTQMERLLKDLFEELQMLRVPEAAKLMGCKEQHVWTLVAKRGIDSVKQGKVRLIPLSAIRKFKDEGFVPALQEK